MSIQYEDGVPVSDQFGDVYFSKHGGLEETSHVFLAGNDLCEDWPTDRVVRVCETGFGTGLNFLSMWRLFDKKKRAGQRLFYTSVEKYPLAPKDIMRSLAPFSPNLGPERIDALVEKYPQPFPGFHPRQIAPDVWLVLIFDDVADALPALNEVQDVWFLDGFSPAQNPEMWQESLYKEMARLSHRDTRFASFTAAGAVGRGLADAGFHVEKRVGFGRKRDMIAGRFGAGAPKATESVAPKSVTIYGSGLAGSAAGWLLNRLGVDVCVQERATTLHKNASSNRCGLINPKIGAARIPAFDYLNGAFALFQSVFQGVKGDVIGFDRRGILHLADANDKAQKHDKFKRLMGQSETIFRTVSYEGLDGIIFPNAGTASPKDLNLFYLKGLSLELSSYSKQESDIALYCGGAHAKDAFSDLPLQKIRGQVSYTKPLPETHPFRDQAHPVLSYGGYAAPMADGRACIGATFQHWSDEEGVVEEDHRRNLDQLGQRFPQLTEEVEIEDGWCGFRLSSKDRLPLIGFYQDNTYLSIAHGSHGMLSSLAAGHIIAYELGLIPQPFSQDVLKALSPQRFRPKL